MTIREIWRRLSPSRYRNALEGEVARLRAENRALLNSILGIAGVPPIPVDIPTNCSEPPRTTHSAPRSGLEAPPSGPGTSSRGELGKSAQGSVRMAAPLRRRSWQQINRMLEFESAKKTTPGDE